MSQFPENLHHRAALFEEARLPLLILKEGRIFILKVDALDRHSSYNSRALRYGKMLTTSIAHLYQFFDLFTCLFTFQWYSGARDWRKIRGRKKEVS